jgi:hypothetical protein
VNFEKKNKEHGFLRFLTKRTKEHQKEPKRTKKNMFKQMPKTKFSLVIIPNVPGKLMSECRIRFENTFG